MLQLWAVQGRFPRQIKIFTTCHAFLDLMPFKAQTWNIPGHMLSGAMAYQILQRENPSTISTVRSTLEKNPWYESRWKSQLEKLPEPERDEMLFMLAARWADDIRTRDKAESRLPWHYIDFPFKPVGEPASTQVVQPPRENIVIAIVENERIVSSATESARREIALSGYFILSVTFTSRSMPHSCSRGSIRMVIAAELRSASIRPGQEHQFSFTGCGMG